MIPGAQERPGRACLDHSAQSETRVGHGSPGSRYGTWSDAATYREARIYPSGELAVSKRVRNAAAKPPEPQRGPRFVSGVSSRGARSIRRAVVARVRQGPAQFVMVTLTTQDQRTDDEMRAALHRFLVWGRKYLGPWFRWYVWAAELQQRGVLHYHLLFDQRIPKPLFRRMRALWAETYGMGSGSVDIRKMRSGKGAAKYMAKYLGKGATAEQVRLDGEGRIGFSPWPVSRHNGQPYERSRFRGNPYGMSGTARWGTVPVTVFWAAHGAFPGLDGWHGVSVFCDSPNEAEKHLAAVLSAGPAPPISA